MATAAGEVTSEQNERRPRKLVVGGYAVCCLVIAVLVTLGAITYQRVEAGQSRATDREAALRSAQQVVTNLTNVDRESVQEDIDRLLRGTTGEFRKQFSDGAASFGKTIAKEQVSSKGTVTETALSRLEGDAAVVLAAVSATVRNSAAKDGQQRQYRFRITLQRSAGAWLVSKLEFVA